MRRREGVRRAGLRTRLRTRARRDRLHLSVMLLLLVVSFAQRIGETTFDTKFDLTADPVAALGRALHLWGTEQNFGGVQNQAYGYLFPQGPWFAAGEVLGLPDWVVQRLWSALILLLAYDGARRLARVLGIGSNAVPVVVGLTYALTPRILGLSGVLSSEVLPSSVLPWVCLPLVLALDGRMSARRAGLLSGLAVLGMGGVNAAENLATFPLPFLLVLSGVRTKPGRSLAAWWVTGTALASAWWMLLLLFQGRYSPPFLDYIETAANTTRTTGWSNAVRGAEHWLNYIFIGGEEWWPAAHSLSVLPVLVLGAGALAAFGLAGLVHRTMPYRVPFGLAALVGLVCLVAGHGGPAGTPLVDTIRELLDGPAAPLRNVHKVDPLVRLPLALGFGSLCMVVATGVRRSARLREAVDRVTPGRVRHLGVAVAVVALLAGSAPMFADQLRHPGWDRMPQAWYEAAAWLDHDGPGTTLVVPSSGIGQQTWGWTVDEPIQGIADSDWAARTQVPLVPAATIRMLDALDQRLEDTGGSAALAESLASAGITRVLLRNDLDVAAGDVAEPARVAAALAASPGLTKVHSFGETDLPGVPLLEVFRVAGGAATPELTGPLPVLTGGPEDVVNAREAGLLDADEHVRVGLAAQGEAPDIVGDGYRRVERNYGRLHGSVSQVMTADEQTRLGREVADYPGVTGVPRVVARYDELRGVVASTSAAYVDGLGRTRPELGPAAAVDGDPATYWSSAPYVDPVGQWVRLDLDRPRPIGMVTVQAGVTDYLGAPVERIAIQAGDRRRVLTVDPETGIASTDFGEARTTDAVKVTVLTVGEHDPNAAVILRDIVVDGLDQRRTLVVPDTGADAHTSFVFTAEPPRRACLQTVLGPSCDIDEARPGAEQGLLSRTFTVHGDGSWQLSGQVVALPSQAAARNLLPLGNAISATSTSVLGDDPSVSAIFAADGKPETSWLAQAGDRDPVLTLTWKKPRRISRMRIDPSLVSSSTPYSADLEGSDGERRSVRLGSGDLGYFEPLRTNKLTISFHTREEVGRETRPMGIGEVRLTGVEDLAHPIATAWDFTGLCGFGPEVRIDGDTFQTRVSGNLDDIVQARPLRWTTCGKDVDLAPGTHRLEATATDTFTPTQLVLRAEAATSTASGTGRTVTATPRADTMDFRVGAGGAAVLVLGQNINAGWHAELDGKVLDPEVVDGWQQGFGVPAGTGGRLEVRFAPGPAYQVALGIGVFAALLLLLLLVVDQFRPSPKLPPVPAPRGPSRAAALRLLLGVALAAALGGPVFAGTVVAGVLLCRVLARGFVATTGAVLVAASAVAAVIGGHLRSGEPVATADLLAAIGVGLLAATLSALTVHEADDGAP